MAIDQTSTGDIGDVDEDNHDSVSPEITQFVDKHTDKDGFLASSKWRTKYKPFDRPGDGFWIENHGDDPPAQSFLPSTAELKNAKQRRAPEYIVGNRYGKSMSKLSFNNQVKLYHRCKKVLVSRDGTVFRATDEEIEAALRADGRGSLSANFYVRVVSEMRRRHHNTRSK